jgi:hypothetical protein
MGPMNIPSPAGFSLPSIIHSTPPPPTIPISVNIQKPKTK